MAINQRGLRRYGQVTSCINYVVLWMRHTKQQSPVVSGDWGKRSKCFVPWWEVASALQSTRLLKFNLSGLTWRYCHGTRNGLTVWWRPLQADAIESVWLDKPLETAMNAKSCYEIIQFQWRSVFVNRERTRAHTQHNCRSSCAHCSNSITITPFAILMTLSIFFLSISRFPFFADGNGEQGKNL